MSGRSGKGAGGGNKGKGKGGKGKGGGGPKFKARTAGKSEVYKKRSKGHRQKGAGTVATVSKEWKSSAGGTDLRAFLLACGSTQPVHAPPRRAPGTWRGTGARARAVHALPGSAWRERGGRRDPSG